MLRDVALFANLNIASFWFAVFFNAGLGVVCLLAYYREKDVRHSEYRAFAMTLWSGGAMMLCVFSMQQYCETVYRVKIMPAASALVALRFYQMQLVFSGITVACLMRFALAVTDSFFRKNTLGSRWHFVVLICTLGVFSSSVLSLPSPGIKGDDFNYKAIGPLFLPYVLMLVLLGLCAYAVMTRAIWPNRFTWLDPIAGRIGITLGNLSQASDKFPSLLQNAIKPIWFGVTILFAGSLLEALQVVFADEGNWGIPMNPRIFGWIVLDSVVAVAFLIEVGRALFDHKAVEAEPPKEAETPNEPKPESAEDAVKEMPATSPETEEDRIWKNFAGLPPQQQEVARRCHKTIAEIAEEVKLARATVKQYLSNIYDVMGVRNKGELIALMTRINLLK